MSAEITLQSDPSDDVTCLIALTRLRMNLANLEKCNKEARDQAQLDKVALRRLSEEKTQLEQEKATAENELCNTLQNMMFEELAPTDEDVRQREAEKLQLEGDYKNAQALLKGKNEALQQLKVRVFELEDQHQDDVALNETLKNENIIGTQLVDSYREKVEKLTSVLTQNESDLTDLTAKVAALAESSRFLEEFSTAQHAQLEEAKKRDTARMEELDEARESIVRHKGEVLASAQVVAELQASLETSKQQLAEYTALVTRVQEQNASILKSFETFKACAQYNAQETAPPVVVADE